MKRFEVIVAPAAAAHIEDIAAWWARNRSAAPGMFVRELDAALLLLQTSPRLGKAYSRSPRAGVRRRLIGRSNYHVYWQVDETARLVRIVAVWHAARGKGPPL